MKVEKFNIETDLDQVMNIWLDSNIDAHDFIDKAYWIDNLTSVRDLLPSAEVLILRANHEIKGFVGVDKGHINGIFVKKEMRGRGCGRLLLESVKKRHKQLSLNVYKKNIPAVNFYKKNGFLIERENLDINTNEHDYFMVFKEEI